MDLAAADRKWATLHQDLPFHDGSFKSWAKERSDSHPYHFSDGVRIWVADVDYSPDDDFLSGRQPQQSPEGDESDKSA